MKEQTFSVKGMTCAGCEGRIQRILESQEGVLHARADYPAACLSMQYDESKLDMAAVSELLEEQEYHLTPISPESVRNGKITKQGSGLERSRGTLTPLQLGALVMLFGVAYITVKNSVGFTFLPEIRPTMGFAALFIVGLLTSLHCVAMCGGLTVSQCVAAAEIQRKASGKNGTGFAALHTSLLHNGGRLTSYTIIGGLAGTLGAAVSFTGWARGLVAIVSGVFMIIMAINLLGVAPFMRKWVPRMPAPLRGFSMKFGKGRSPFVIGLLNGLMPCGPLQGMQLYALGTGSAAVGAASMFFFSLGTAPLMIGLGSLTSLLGGKMTAAMMKISAIVVLALGLVMLDRGFALSGIALI